MSSSNDRLMNAHNQWALFRANKKHGTLVVKKELLKNKDRQRLREREKNRNKKLCDQKIKKVLKNLITSSYRISKRWQK